MVFMQSCAEGRRSSILAIVSSQHYICQTLTYITKLSIDLVQRNHARDRESLFFPGAVFTGSFGWHLMLRLNRVDLGSIRVGLGRRPRAGPQFFADRLEHHIKWRDGEDADEGREDHAAEHGRADVA